MRRATFALAALLLAPFGLQAQWAGVLTGSRSSSTPAYNPQTQGTLVSWWDGSVLGLSNGANVNPFTDSKTGAPHSLTTVATYAIYATNQQNSLGTVSFDGVNQYYTVGGPDASTYPYTIAAVIKVPDHGNFYTILGAGSAAGLAFYLESGTGNLVFSSASTAGIGTGTSALGTGSYHLVVGVVTSSTYAFYIDGVAAGNGTHSVPLVPGSIFQLGSQTGSFFFSGFMGEVQLYSSALNGSDLSGLHAYIVSKWGTP